jgi:adenylate kinase
MQQDSPEARGNEQKRRRNMESNNEIAVVGLVPRVVALALAFATTSVISISVATIFTADGAQFLARTAAAPLRAIVGL